MSDDPTKDIWSNPDFTTEPEPSNLIGDYDPGIESVPDYGTLDEPAAGPEILVPISATQLCSDHKELRPVLIDGIARETEVINFVSVSKCGKTLLAMGLALSLATGRQWLDTFAVQQGAVLYIDCELHPQTLAKRVSKIASGMGILSAEFEGRFDLLSLRGKLKDLIALGPMFRSFGRGKYRLIILDALYRLTPEGFDENSNAHMTRLYNLLDNYAELTGAAFIVIHHASKGHQSGKAVIDVGSGAGAQSRAADTHIVLRPHEEPGIVVMEGAIRSFAPLPPLCLKLEYPTWTPATECDPTHLAEVKSRRLKAEKAAAEPQPEKPKPELWTPERFVSTFVSAEPKEKRTILARAATTPGLSEKKAENLCRIARADKLIHPWTYTNDRRLTYLATKEQPVTETVEVPK